MSYLHLIIKKDLSFQYSPYAKKDGGKFTSDIIIFTWARKGKQLCSLEKVRRILFKNIYTQFGNYPWECVLVHCKRR